MPYAEKQARLFHLLKALSKHVPAVQIKALRWQRSALEFHTALNQ